MCIFFRVIYRSITKYIWKCLYVHLFQDCSDLTRMRSRAGGTLLRWIYRRNQVATCLITDKALSLALCSLSETPAWHY